jgi:transposase
MINCGTVTEEKDVKSNPEVNESFRHRLVGIYNKRKQDLRLTDDYKRIEAQIKQACEKAAYDGRNCVYIMDLHLENYINYSYYIRDNGQYLEKTVEQICEDLGLDIKGGYITWKNSL